MNKPLVSIVLPVYNAGVYLKEAIQSILDQTYTNFELIIINDGSTDDSEKLIKSYTDQRICYIFQQNTGLAGALNTGLKAAKGKYIARQDQDDISLRERLQKQVEFLESHPDINLLGTRATVFTDDQKEMKMHDHAIEPAILRFDLLFDNPFVHSSVMFRKTAIDSIGLYNTDRSYYEDFELWSRFAFHGRVANLRDALVRYRHHDQGLSKTTGYFKEDAVLNQAQLNLSKLIGKKEDRFDDLCAVYHFKEKRYKGTKLSDLRLSLNEISRKIQDEFPESKSFIIEREQAYFKVIRYKMNYMDRKRFEGNSFKQFLLKVEMKIHGSHPYITND